MIDYATIPNTIGAYPVVVGKNTSGGGAIDGTPWLKSLVDDWFGFSQNIMNRAGPITPSGAAEAGGALGAPGELTTSVAATINSQRMQGIARICGFPGEIVPWHGQDNSSDFADDPPGVDYTDPSLIGIRLLPLSGQGVLRSLYRDLDRVVYCGDSNNPSAWAYYHADDAGGVVRNPAGLWLILLDLRGFFIRGYDASAIRDPEGASRLLYGFLQADALEDHQHAVEDTGGPDHLSMTSLTVAGGPTLIPEAKAIPGPNLVNATTISGGSWTVETRPINNNAKWCIRY